VSKISESAKGQDCTIRLPGCNGNPETVVLAHINGIRFGHGVGKKVNDIHGAYACSHCHDVVDRRKYTNISNIEIKLAHYEGVLETQIRLIEKGLL